MQLFTTKSAVIMRASAGPVIPGIKKKKKTMYTKFYNQSHFKISNYVIYIDLQCQQSKSGQKNAINAKGMKIKQTFSDLRKLYIHFL